MLFKRVESASPQPNEFSLNRPTTNNNCRNFNKKSNNNNHQEYIRNGYKDSNWNSSK